MPPRDRLAELKDLTAGTSEGGVRSVSINIPSSNNSLNAASQELMKDFFKQVEDIKAATATIKRQVQEIEQQHSRALSAVGETQSDNNKALDDLMESTNGNINKVRTALKAMEAANRQAGADPSKLDSLSGEQRIRLTQHGNLTTKFMEVVTEYQTIQTNYKNKFKDRMVRQFKIIKPMASAEEISQLLETGRGDLSQMFAQQILMGPQHAEAKKALNDIQERHQEIIKLEKSILELNQLFLDMSVLVDAQGEMINQIEHYVSNAADQTFKGVDEMRKAVKNQRKARKRMCCILFIIAAVVIVAVMVGILWIKN